MIAQNKRRVLIPINDNEAPLSADESLDWFVHFMHTLPTLRFDSPLDRAQFVLDMYGEFLAVSKQLEERALKQGGQLRFIQKQFEKEMHCGK